MARILDKSEIGRRLRKYRHDAGLTLERLSEMIGISYQQLQKYENGSTKLGTDLLQELAKALGVPVCALFDEKPLEDMHFSENELKLITCFRRLKTQRSRESLLTLLSELVE